MRYDHILMHGISTSFVTDFPLPQGVYFESVPLDNDAYIGGWAAVHFLGDEDASVALER